MRLKVLWNIWKITKSTWHRLNALNALEGGKWDLSLTCAKESPKQPHRDETLILPFFMCLTRVCRNGAMAEEGYALLKWKMAKKKLGWQSTEPKPPRILWLAGQKQTMCFAKVMTTRVIAKTSAPLQVAAHCWISSVAGDCEKRSTIVENGQLDWASVRCCCSALHWQWCLDRLWRTGSSSLSTMGEVGVISPWIPSNSRQLMTQNQPRTKAET